MKCADRYLLIYQSSLHAFYYSDASERFAIGHRQNDVIQLPFKKPRILLLIGSNVQCPKSKAGLDDVLYFVEGGSVSGYQFSGSIAFCESRVPSCECCCLCCCAHAHLVRCPLISTVALQTADTTTANSADINPVNNEEFC
jgi:hypothetical protein